MAVIVTDTDGVAETYDDAEKWHVDEERQLHVVASGGGNVAAYSCNAWRSVRRSD